MKWHDTKVKFEPWFPDRDAARIEGRRVLILGESHYHDCMNDQACKNCATSTKRDHYHRSLTRTVVNGWRDGDRRSPLSYRVPLLFGIGPSEFWPKVVFYNYVQEFVGKAPKVPQKAELWSERNNAEAFQSVLDRFQPERILVLGKKLWTNLPSNPELLGVHSPRPEFDLRVSNNVGSYNLVDECCYWYTTTTGVLGLAMPIMHPSAPRFKLADWIEPVTDWMNFGR